MGMLSRDQVIEVCGPLDDLRIAQIIGTGATRDELIAARSWMVSYEVLGAAFRSTVTGTVAKVVAVLRQDEESEWDDRS